MIFSKSEYNAVIDYRNAKYQGKLISNLGNDSNKVFKNGPGILVDDEMNFLYSNWKNNQLNGRTVLINRFGNYIYGKWSH